MAEDLIVTVAEIAGTCPVYKLGDSFVIEKGYILKAREGICLHALASILPFYTSLARGVSPEELGLGREDAFVQCPDPCRITNGGTVIFRISRG